MNCLAVIAASRLLFLQMETLLRNALTAASGQQATSRWAFEKFWIIKLAATALGGIGGASVTRPWIGAMSPRHANLLPALLYWWGRERGSGGDVRLSI